MIFMKISEFSWIYVIFKNLVIFSKSASKISIILRHQVKVVKSCENDGILGKKLIFRGKS